MTHIPVEEREAQVKTAIVVILLAAVPALADDVYLRGGGQITGEIVEQTEDSVSVDIGGGSLTVKMSSVERIERSVSPMQEYKARAAQIPTGDAEAWRDLARWATGNALSSQVWDAYSHVVAILPDDEEANRTLGRVRLDGRWVSEDESYKARGYIEFEGEWMTPAERQTILADRQARDDEYRRVNEARIQTIEAEQKAQKEREKAESEASSGGLPVYGDPVYWGWGAGPGYWSRLPVQLPAAPVGTVGGGRK
jgi:hypothetical protein